MSRLPFFPTVCETYVKASAGRSSLEYTLLVAAVSVLGAVAILTISSILGWILLRRSTATHATKEDVPQDIRQGVPHAPRQGVRQDVRQDVQQDVRQYSNTQLFIRANRTINNLHDALVQERAKTANAMLFRGKKIMFEASHKWKPDIFIRQLGQKYFGWARSSGTELGQLSDEQLEMHQCTICLGVYEEGEDTMKLPCGHRFHEECITHWFKTKLSCARCTREFEMKAKIELVEKKKPSYL